jgi:hypothetical protein
MRAMGSLFLLCMSPKPLRCGGRFLACIRGVNVVVVLRKMVLLRLVN